jgi:AcrR family transcriptional regulator
MSGANYRGSEEHVARLGRPRDPEVEARIKRAAMEAVAERGIAGLSVDLICSRAGVPRSTFYRRWRGARDVLFDAFDDRITPPALPDTGDLPGDLVAYALGFLDLFKDPVFAACHFYIFAETRLDPDLRAQARAGFSDRRARNRTLVERAVARGEVKPNLRADLILDAILGLVMAWAGSPTPPNEAEIQFMIKRLIEPDLRPQAVKATF